MSCFTFNSVAIVARQRVLWSAIVSVLGVGSVASSAQAALLVAPAGLAPGATFRYIYVTTATTDGLATAAAPYNIVASNDATAQGYTSYNGSALTWKALVSTTAGSAGSLIPAQDAFFTPAGIKVAATTAALFNTTSVPLLAPITSSSALIWTGTKADGTTGKAMGTNSNPSYPNVGVGNTTNAAWLSAAATPPPATLEAVYAFSNELTVAVPEPTSLGAIAIAGAAVLRRRRTTRD